MEYKREAKVHVEVLNEKPPSNQRLQRVPRNIFLFEFFVESWMKFVVSRNTKKGREQGKEEAKKLHFRLAENRSFSVTFRRSLSQVANHSRAGLAHKGCLQHGNWDRGFKASTAGRAHTAGEVNCRWSQGQPRGSPFYAKVVCRVMRRNYGNLGLFSLKRIWIMHSRRLIFLFSPLSVST